MLKRSDKAKPPYGSRTHRLGITFAVIGLLSLLFCLGDKNQPTQIIVKHVSQSHPTVEIQNGTQSIWKIPNKPKAVLFIAHGCHRKASDFWDKSPSCPQCTSLPEERVLVRTALSKSFAVITVSSASTCWTFGKEKRIVRDVIRTWIKKHNLEKLPLVALGASSGGYFVSALAMDMEFSSIVLMIAEGVFDRIRVTKRYPPTLFVHMPKDVFRQQKVREFLQGLRMEGVDAAEVECLDLQMSPGFLADRIEGFDRGVSEKVFEVLREKGFVDEKGYMKRDGRRTPWKEALSGYKISLEESLVTPVEEELNLAYAYHEMTSLQSEQIFNWFESHMG
ncbi:Secretion-regulating guanine nucleotide exchange factor [Hirschfeldia incana]|nr:Secretion-regulating guanine nucleotide exchange factor [Hirschfeldia incana]